MRSGSVAFWAIVRVVKKLGNADFFARRNFWQAHCFTVNNFNLPPTHPTALPYSGNLKLLPMRVLGTAGGGTGTRTLEFPSGTNAET